MKHSARWQLSLLLCLLGFSPANARAQTGPSSEVSFPVLPGLENAVEFWKRIFAEFGISQLVFFDPQDMSKIYEIVDAGEDNRSQDYVNGERARIAAAHGVDLERVKAQRGIKERTAAGLKRSGRLIGQMQQIFRDRGLPVELTYLPLVESSFEINARSYAGALGMWQFMRTTGKQFLRVNRQIDERKDPLESTRAAASLLDQNYQVLGNWPLAVTAYNYGAAGLARAVAETGSDDLVELIQNYNHRNWGFPSKNFYAEFLAAVHIAKNVDRYFPGLELQSPVKIHEIELKNGTSIAALFNSTGLTRERFLEWNPALNPGLKIVPAGYRVKVPADGNREPPVVEVQHRPKDEEPMIRHRVKRGETIVQIAQRYRASVDRILQINGIRRPHLVRAGTMLLVPKL